MEFLEIQKMRGDLKDEYLRMFESTANESMYRFYRAVVGKFGPHYLRGLNAEETTPNEARDFHGMLGIIDCMH
jgi:hypothetical protein